MRRAQVHRGDVAMDVAAWAASLTDPARLAGADVDGDPVIVAGAEAWRVTGDVAVVLSACNPVPFTPAATGDATVALRAAIAAAHALAAGAAPTTWTAELERAVAVLASDGTGEELSDVAWPHFLLPEGYPTAARRLAAAAATAWLWDGPGAWSGEVAERAHQPLRDAVGPALVAAVAA